MYMVIGWAGKGVERKEGCMVLLTQVQLWLKQRSAQILLVRRKENSSNYSRNSPLKNLGSRSDKKRKYVKSGSLSGVDEASNILEHDVMSTGNYHSTQLNIPQILGFCGGNYFSR
jgi:hypothetical protein